jgi:hypothetical protein
MGIPPFDSALLIPPFDSPFVSPLRAVPCRIAPRGRRWLFLPASWVAARALTVALVACHARRARPWQRRGSTIVAFFAFFLAGCSRLVARLRVSFASAVERRCRLPVNAGALTLRRTDVARSSSWRRTAEPPHPLSLRSAEPPQSRARAFAGSARRAPARRRSHRATPRTGCRVCSEPLRASCRAPSPGRSIGSARVARWSARVLRRRS